MRFYDPSGHDACPKALHDQMKRQGIPDVEIAQKVQDMVEISEKMGSEIACYEDTGWIQRFSKVGRFV